MLIKLGGVIISSDETVDGPSYILTNDDGMIDQVGYGDYVGDLNGTLVVNKEHTVAIPGLVNSHGHAAMTLLRGIGDDLPLKSWLNDKVLPAEEKLTSEAVYWGTMLAIWEMVTSGTTCFTDMYMFMHDAAQAVHDSGMRAVLSWGMVGFDAQGQDRAIQNSREFVTRWHGYDKGRITTTLGPHAPYTCPPEFLSRITELSGELDVPIQIHLSETQVEVENSVREWGVSPISHVHASGLLERPVLAAHCVHVSSEDIALMAMKDVRVAHNPQSNLKLASGVAPIVQMHASGLTIGLGTDGAASNNNLDMFEELRLAATLHKGVLMEPKAVPAKLAFRMATEDSARAVFLPSGHGTLRAGNRADIVLLDKKSPHFIPNHSLLSNIVYSAGASDVLDVYIQGVPVVSNRQCTSIDTERVTFEVNRIKDQLVG